MAQQIVTLLNTQHAYNHIPLFRPGAGPKDNNCVRTVDLLRRAVDNCAAVQRLPEVEKIDGLLNKCEFDVRNRIWTLPAARRNTLANVFIELERMFPPVNTTLQEVINFNGLSGEAAGSIYRRLDERIENLTPGTVLAEADKIRILLNALHRAGHRQLHDYILNQRPANFAAFPQLIREGEQALSGLHAANEAHVNSLSGRQPDANEPVAVGDDGAAAQRRLEDRLDVPLDTLVELETMYEQLRRDAQLYREQQARRERLSQAARRGSSNGHYRGKPQWSFVGVPRNPQYRRDYDNRGHGYYGGPADNRGPQQHDNYGQPNRSVQANRGGNFNGPRDYGENRNFGSYGGRNFNNGPGPRRENQYQHPRRQDDRNDRKRNGYPGRDNGAPDAKRSDRDPGPGNEF